LYSEPAGTGSTAVGGDPSRMEWDFYAWEQPERKTENRPACLDPDDVEPLAERGGGEKGPVRGATENRRAVILLVV